MRTTLIIFDDFKLLCFALAIRVNYGWFLESQLSKFQSGTGVNFVFYSTLL